MNLYKDGVIEEINIAEFDTVKIGHAQDNENMTGVTVLLFDKKAIAGIDISGGGHCLFKIRDAKIRIFQQNREASFKKLMVGLLSVKNELSDNCHFFYIILLWYSDTFVLTKKKKPCN